MTRLVLWPAVLTLAVSLLRLFAELRDWGATLANEEGGGPGAVIGISWLMFVFGAYFGWRLARAGRAPARPGLAALGHLGCIVVALGLGFGVVMAFGGPQRALPGALVVNFAVYTAAAALSVRCWPELGQVNLLYGLLARLPVIAITVVAVPMAWDTHYEKLGPGDGVAMDALPRTLWLCATQVFVWVPMTVLFGGLTGSLAALLARRSVSASPSP